MKYKNYNIPDKEIDNLMDKLDLSLAEACEMWLSDNDIVENETVEKLTKQAKENRVTATIHQAKGERKERKPREKKENPLKKTIIDVIFNAICENLVEKDKITVTNTEKYIDFSLNGRDFTVNLVEHRKKKGE